MSISNARAVALAAAAYLLLTIAYAWPLPVHLMHGVAHDPGDPLLNAWILWWTTKAVPLTSAWWNAPMFYPAPGTFAFSEHLLGFAPLTAPLIALTHNALFGYNVALLATFVCSALGAYFLGYTLTRRHDAAFVAGLAFAFAPYRVSQLPHIQVLAAYFAPVCLAALHRYDTDRRLRWTALAAGAWFMQALTCGYYMFFLSVLLFLWLLWFVPGRWKRREVAVVAACFAVAAALIAPVLTSYKHILIDTYGFRRELQAVQEFSANVAALFTASEESWLWGWLRVYPRPEGELFPGLTIILLSIFAVFAARPFAHAPEASRTRTIRRALGAATVLCLVAAALPIVYGSWRFRIGDIRLLSISRADTPLTIGLIALLAWLSMFPAVAAAVRRRSPLVFYGFAAVAMWMLALGPDPMLFDKRVLYRAPYGWLMRLPGLDGLRVPARFWMMAVVCLAALAALAINRVQNRPTRRIVVAIASVALLLDGWPREFTVAQEPERRLAPPGVAVRLDLPMTDDRDAVALYLQTLDPIPLFNGFSGWGAPHQYAMRELLHAGDARILQALTARGSVGVVIDHESDVDARLRQFVGAFPGAVQHETHPSWSSYRVPARPAEDQVPDRGGAALRIKALDAFPSPPHTPRAVDGDLKTRWSGGVQRAAADFTIELEQPSHVGQVVTDLGPFWTDFPRRLKIEVSPDGASWETAYLGDTALHAYYGALRHPREVPLVFAIDRDNVRFIRLQQLGWGTHDWSIAEVHVLR